MTDIIDVTGNGKIIRNAEYFPDDCISDAEMKHLGNLIGLSEFKFNMENVTDNGIAHLHRYEKLMSGLHGW
jgi:hypothetical protein